MAIEDLRAERGALSRWLTLYMRNLDRLEDHAALENARRLALETDLLFAVQGWAPVTAVSELRSYAENNGLALEVRQPTVDETPPIAMENPQQLSFGEQLLAFYQLPGYHDWDPSSVVFISFALFFAMILADAGYGALLGVGLLLSWKRMGASEAGRGFRRLSSWIVVASLAFGALIGSYFGVSPAAGTLLDRLKIMDINDFDTMMKLSIVIGGLHVILANATTAWHRRASDPGAGAARLGGHHRRRPDRRNRSGRPRGGSGGADRRCPPGPALLRHPSDPRPARCPRPADRRLQGRRRLVGHVRRRAQLPAAVRARAGQRLPGADLQQPRRPGGRRQQAARASPFSSAS